MLVGGWPPATAGGGSRGMGSGSRSSVISFSQSSLNFLASSSSSVVDPPAPPPPPPVDFCSAPASVRIISSICFANSFAKSSDNGVSSGSALDVSGAFPFVVVVVVVVDCDCDGGLR